MKNFDSKTALVLSKKLSFSPLNSIFFDFEIARFISQNLFLKNLDRFLKFFTRQISAFFYGAARSMLWHFWTVFNVFD